MLEVIIFIGIVLGLSVLLYIAKNYQIKKNETDFAATVLNLAVVVLKNTEFKNESNKAKIEDVCQSLLIAITVIDNSTKELTIDEAIQLIKLKTIEICQTNGIEVDEELSTAILNVLKIVIYTL